MTADRAELRRLLAEVEDSYWPNHLIEAWLAGEAS